MWVRTPRNVPQTSQSAVSPISNRRGVARPEHAGNADGPQTGSPATQQPGKSAVPLRSVAPTFTQTRTRVANTSTLAQNQSVNSTGLAAIKANSAKPWQRRPPRSPLPTGRRIRRRRGRIARQMDPFLPPCAAANPTFVANYQHARLIVDSGGGKAKPTPPPPPPASPA